jgi:hypothetical protein
MDCATDGAQHDRDVVSCLFQIRPEPDPAGWFCVRVITKAYAERLERTLPHLLLAIDNIHRTHGNFSHGGCRPKASPVKLTLLRHFLNDLAQCLYTRDVW